MPGSVTQPPPDRRQIPCATTPQGPGRRRPPSLLAPGGPGKISASAPKGRRRRRTSARSSCSGRASARRGSMATASASSAQSAYWPQASASLRRSVGNSLVVNAFSTGKIAEMPLRCRWSAAARPGCQLDRSSPPKSPPTKDDHRARPPAKAIEQPTGIENQRMWSIAAKPGSAELVCVGHAALCEGVFLKKACRRTQMYVSPQAAARDGAGLRRRATEDARPAGDLGNWRLLGANGREALLGLCAGCDAPASWMTSDHEHRPPAPRRLQFRAAPDRRR